MVVLQEMILHNDGISIPDVVFYRLFWEIFLAQKLIRNPEPNKFKKSSHKREKI